MIKYFWLVMGTICIAYLTAFFVKHFLNACDKIDQIHAKLYGKTEPDKHPLAGLTKDPEEES